MKGARAAAALLLFAVYFTCSAAAPTSEQTGLDLYEDGTKDSCYYNFQHYGEGDRIMTNEPCLNCTCHNRMLMCYLRVCPFTKPVGQDCTVEKRGDQCCPVITCPDVPVDLLTSSSSTTSPAEYGSSEVGHLDKYGCSIEGRFFPEGSKVPPNPKKPCELCYCIRNMTTCVMQECTLHVDGCTPVYQKDACCPVRYSCDHSEDEIPMLDDMTTTVRPTTGFLLTTTMAPGVTQDCLHQDEIFPDGALIKTEKACEHCYCMKGDIVCVVQECGTPMENEGKNCTSLPPRDGQCCPDTYICEGDMIEENPDSELTTIVPMKESTTSGTEISSDEQFSSPATTAKSTVDEEGSGIGDLENTEPSSDQNTATESIDSVIADEIPSTTSKLLTRQEEEASSSSESDEQNQEKPSLEESISITPPDRSEEPSEPSEQVTEQPMDISSEYPERTTKLSGQVPETTLTPTEASLHKESAPKVEKGPEELQPPTESTGNEPEIRPHDTYVEPGHPVDQVTEQVTDTVKETYTNIIEDSKTEKSDEIIPSVSTEQTTPQYTQYTIEDKTISPPEQFVDETSGSMSDLPKTTNMQDFDTTQTEKVATSPELIEEITESPLDSNTDIYSNDDINKTTASEVVYPQATEHALSDTEKSTPANEEYVTAATDEMKLPSEASPPETLEESGEQTDNSSTYHTETPRIETSPKTDASVTEPQDVKEQETLETTLNPAIEPEDFYTTKSSQDVSTPVLTDISVEGITEKEQGNTISSTASPTEQDILIESTTKNVYGDESTNSDTQGPSEEAQITTVVESSTAKLTQEPGTTPVPAGTPIDEEESSTIPVALGTLPPIADSSVTEPASSNAPDDLEEHTVIFGSPVLKDESVVETDASTEHSEIISVLPLSTEPSTITLEPESHNEVEEESILPHIPGEGDCLVEGITYSNDTQVPSTNKCQVSCKCVSSIIKCEQIQCSPPPENMLNCQPMYDVKESCCPTYVCDHTKETSAPESHNQMLDITTGLPKITIEEITVNPIDKISDHECSTGQCAVKEPTIESINVPDLCGSEGCINSQDHSEKTDIPVVLDCAGESCLPIRKDTSPIGPQIIPIDQLVTESSIPQCSGNDCNIASPTSETHSSPQEQDQTSNPELDNKQDYKPGQLPEVPVIVSLDCAGESCPPTKETTSLVAPTTIPAHESPTEHSSSSCSGGDCNIGSSSLDAELTQHGCNGVDCKNKGKPISPIIPIDTPCRGDECALPTQSKPFHGISTDANTSEDCKSDSCAQSPLSGSENKTSECIGEQCAPLDENLAQKPTPTINEINQTQIDQEAPSTTATYCSGEDCHGQEPVNQHCSGYDCVAVPHVLDTSCTQNECENSMTPIPQDSSSECTDGFCNYSPTESTSCEGNQCDVQTSSISCEGDQCQHPTPEVPISKPSDENKDSVPATEICKEDECKKPIDISPQVGEDCNTDNCGKITDVEVPIVISPTPLTEGLEGDCSEEGCKKPVNEKEKPLDDISKTTGEYLSTTTTLDILPTGTPDTSVSQIEYQPHPEDDTSASENDKNITLGTSLSTDVPEIQTTATIDDANESIRLSNETNSKPTIDIDLTQVTGESSTVRVVPTLDQIDRLPSTESIEKETTSLPLVETYEGSTNQMPEAITTEVPTSEEAEEHDGETVSELTTRAPILEYSEKQTENTLSKNTTPTLIEGDDKKQTESTVPQETSSVPASEDDKKQSESTLAQETTATPLAEDGKIQTESTIKQETTQAPLSEDDDGQTESSFPQETKPTPLAGEAEEHSEINLVDKTATPVVENTEHQTDYAVEEGTTQQNELSSAITETTLLPEPVVETSSLTPGVNDGETGVEATTVSNVKQENMEPQGPLLIIEPEATTLSSKEHPSIERTTTESNIYIEPMESTSITEDHTPMSHITEGPLMSDETSEEDQNKNTHTPLDHTTNIFELGITSDEITPAEPAKITEAPIPQIFMDEKTTKSSIIVYTRQEESESESPQTNTPTISDVQATEQPKEPLVTEINSLETSPVTEKESLEFTAGEVITTSEQPSEYDQRISTSASTDKSITSLSPDLSNVGMDNHESEQYPTSSSDNVSEYSTTSKPSHEDTADAPVEVSNEVEQPEQLEQQTEKSELPMSPAETYSTLSPVYSDSENPIYTTIATSEVDSDSKHTNDQSTDNYSQSISEHTTSKLWAEITTIATELLYTESPALSTESVQRIPQSTFEPSDQAENTIPSEHTTSKSEEHMMETEEIATIGDDRFNSGTETSVSAISEIEEKTTVGLTSPESQEKGTTPATISESHETEILFTDTPAAPEEFPGYATTEAEGLAATSISQEPEIDNEVEITTQAVPTNAEEISGPIRPQSQTEDESRPESVSPNVATKGPLEIVPAYEETQNTTMGTVLYVTPSPALSTIEDMPTMDTQAVPEKEVTIKPDEVSLHESTTVVMPSEEIPSTSQEQMSSNIPEVESINKPVTTGDETKVSQNVSVTEAMNDLTEKPELPSNEKVETQHPPLGEEPVAEQSPDHLPDTSLGSDDLPSPQEDIEHQSPQLPSGYPPTDNDYDQEEDQAFGPGTCRYGGKVFVSAQQIPRDDPCDFCFCFRSDIICLQQSCPPPIHGCHEEPISGFCCPRYECPVAMATTLNVTTTSTTTTTTLPPHFLPHAYKGAAQRRGCYIKGHTYKVGEVVRSSSGPCLHCTCGGDGQMKCDPKVCTPEPMLRQMIAAAVSTKRRR